MLVVKIYVGEQNEKIYNKRIVFDEWTYYKNN